jgi:hypothetical protein
MDYVCSCIVGMVCSSYITHADPKKATILPTIAKRAAKAQKELTHKAYVYDSLREK